MDNELKKFIYATINEWDAAKFNNEKIRFKYTDDEYGRAAKNFEIPSRSYDGDAGIDLPIILPDDELEHGKIIWENERVMLHTGLMVEFPVGYHGRIIHRSSTEKRSRLRIVEGVIDDYRGELMVQVHNGNSSKVEVYHGQKLAQLIVIRSAPFTIEIAEELRPSARGNKGYGSSGFMAV